MLRWICSVSRQSVMLLCTARLDMRGGTIGMSCCCSVTILPAILVGGGSHLLGLGLCVVVDHTDVGDATVHHVHRQERGVGAQRLVSRDCDRCLRAQVARSALRSDEPST